MARTSLHLRLFLALGLLTVGVFAQQALADGDIETVPMYCEVGAITGCGPITEVPFCNYVFTKGAKCKWCDGTNIITKFCQVGVGGCPSTDAQFCGNEFYGTCDYTTGWRCVGSMLAGDCYVIKC